MKDWVKELERLMGVLRGENGCPWDVEQTHQSLKPYLVEEAYEVLDAIDEEDDQKLTSELGDVLLQVVFHSQIAKEEERFNLQDVARSCCEMLIRRHPHVFGEARVESASDVTRQWQEIKQKERQKESSHSLLDTVSHGLPALSYAQELQQKAAKVGFDFRSQQELFEKIQEELDELREELDKGDQKRALEELGDLLLATVHMIRTLKGDAEVLLRSASAKFKKRFTIVEGRVTAQGREIQECSWEELVDLWIEAKKVTTP